MLSRLISGLICALLLTSSVSGQDDDSLWSRNFGPVGVSGTVKALQHWGDSLVVAGNILGLRQTGAFSREFLIFDLVDRTWHLQKTGPLGTDAEIRALEVLPNGDLVIGGSFSFSSNGMTFDNIAVLHKDGSWSTLSGDSSDLCTGPVNALLRHDDRLYIGGEFDQIGDNETIITELFAIWDESQGFLGTSNEPIGFVFDPDETAAVHALMRVPFPSAEEHTVLAAGNFMRRPGDTLGNVARIDISSRVVSSLSVPQTNGPVYALHRSGSYVIFVGGKFTIAGDSTVSNCFIYAQNDGTYNTLGDGLNGPVYAFTSYALHTSPRFAGDFDSSGAVAVGSLPAWDRSSGTWETSPLTVDGPIYAIESILGKFLAVGGDFEYVGDSSRFHNVFMTQSPSQLNDSLQWSLGDGFDSHIYSTVSGSDVAVDDSGNFYVSGSFHYAGGLRVNHVAKWDGQKWRALGEGLGSAAGAIAVNGDTVYVSGNLLSSAGGIAVSKIAMWDGMQWSDMDGGLSAGSVDEMAIDTLGNLYIVGSGFDMAGSVTVAGIARWDGAQWSAVGGPVTPGTSASVDDIYIDSLTNEVFICGAFNGIDNVATNGVGKWDGSSWTGLGNVKTRDGIPNVIERSPQGEIIVAGFFSLPSFIRNYNDTLWIGYAGGVASPDVSDLHTVGCHVYLAGNPLQYVGEDGDPLRVYNIARWDGLEWQPLGSGLNLGVRNVAHYENELALVGSFTQLHNTDIYTRGFAIWNGVVSGAESTDLTLLSPTVNDTLEYGTVYDITWDTATSADLVLVEVSLDSGATWEVIHNRADAKRGRLPWLVPDTTAAYCKIRISDGNAPCAAVEEPFTFPITSDTALESWWLTHAGGTYYKEPFLPGYTGFSFGNNRSNMWPDSVWKNVDYSDFPEPPDSIENFPDWYLYCEAFGDDWCYRNGNTDRPRPRAIKHWQAILTKWGGSCLGFSAASLIWLYGNEFNANLLIPYEPLYYLGYNPLTRDAANKHWIYQTGDKHLEHDAEARSLTPYETMNLIRDDFTASFARSLSFSYRSWKDKLDEDSVVVDSIWRTQAHNVVPYHIRNVPDSQGIYYIYYYDSNRPTSQSKWARIDSTNATWRIPDYYDTDTTSRFIPRLPANEWYGLANDDRVTVGLRQPASSHFVKVFTTATEEILISDSLGNEIGWADNQEVVNGLDGGPIFSDDPDYQYNYPSGYLVPSGKYTVSLSKYEGDDTRLTWMTDTTMLIYHRDGTLSDQSERLTIRDNAMSVAGIAGLYENISLSTVQTTGSSERFVEISGMTFAPIDSLEFSIDSAGAITIWNTGIAKAYQLVLWNADAALPEDEMTQSSSSTLINSDMTQKIIPAWGMLEASTTLLLKDADQDGTFEDTTVMDIVTDVEDDGLPELPDTYRLGQNYPNPFNPSTTIDFSIPTAGEVRLEVINVLGQRVATLVDGSLAAGEHTVVWNGTNAAGVNVASGIYFYRLLVEGFATSKKMLLLR